MFSSCFQSQQRAHLSKRTKPIDLHTCLSSYEDTSLYQTHCSVTLTTINTIPVCFNSLHHSILHITMTIPAFTLLISITNHAPPLPFHSWPLPDLPIPLHPFNPLSLQLSTPHASLTYHPYNFNLSLYAFPFSLPLTHPLLPLPPLFPPPPSPNPPPCVKWKWRSIVPFL